MEHQEKSVAKACIYGRLNKRQNSNRWILKVQQEEHGENEEVCVQVLLRVYTIPSTAAGVGLPGSCDHKRLQLLELRNTA